MINKECLVIRRIEIDMGHRVPAHKSKCRNLHGHRYVFEVGVYGPVNQVQNQSKEGMVVDFSELKTILLEEIDNKLDHGFMMYDKDPLAGTFRGFSDQKIIFVPFIPTAENIAGFVFENLKEKINSLGLKLSFVKVWETPNCSAVYEPR